MSSTYIISQWNHLPCCRPGSLIDLLIKKMTVRMNFLIQLFLTYNWLYIMHRKCYACYVRIISQYISISSAMVWLHAAGRDDCGRGGDVQSIPQEKGKFLARSWITGENDSGPNWSCDDRLGLYIYTILWNINYYRWPSRFFCRWNRLYTFLFLLS